MPDEVALQRLNVVVRDNDRLVPTLGGLLTLGQYPQQFFPQLNVTFVVVPGTSLDGLPEGGPRFIDNRSLDGPIPAMVEDTVAAVLRNMSIRSYVEGAGRRDVYDYPVEAVREAVINALLHRDYSPYARGTQVQVEMYTDRLVVRNPGGLFGVVTEETLGSEGISSSRNAVLARLLQDVWLPGTDRVVCENRGSGIPTMIKALRRAGLSLPEFRSQVTNFRLTIPRRSLGDADLTVEPPAPDASGDDRVLAVFGPGEELSRQDIESRTGLGSSMVIRILRRLLAAGTVGASAPPRSRNRRYYLRAQ